MITKDHVNPLEQFWVNPFDVAAENTAKVRAESEDRARRIASGELKLTYSDRPKKWKKRKRIR